MKNLQGVISSLKSTKTAIVTVDRMWSHPLYKKSVVRSKKYACDYAADMTLAMGDHVEIQETKPISKTKRFKVVKVLGK
ncbi:30S ribosomal protein S17 [bioreactor metagenome]|jgi:small subunit ribosomal protein S17|uniref:30S ribosomal protein S17 n=1 Tax=bioreactor metagenome TaxID=1076179 RepID=A0A645CT88_9ZZZZ